MFFRRVVQPSPGDQPEKTQRARNHEGRSPSPAEINRKHDKWSDGATDRRTTVKKRRGQCSLTFWKPLRHSLRSAHPLRPFASTPHNTKYRHTLKPIR